MARCTMNPSEPRPMMPIPTITAITIRMILRAPPPLLFVATTGGGVVTPTGLAAAGTVFATAPHLLQNLVPSFRVAPQELQNAMGHLAAMIRLDGRVYQTGS